MKKVFMLVTATLLVAIGMKNAYFQSVSDEIVRFHVIADSNSSYDQLIKINLRNIILDELSDELINCTTKEETLIFLENNIERCRRLSIDFFEKIEYDKDVCVQLVRNSFPKKKYTDFTLPYGIYDALKITIGSGKGKNFFCVLFPQSCISPEMTEKVDNILNSKRINYKLKFLQIIKGD